MGEVSGYMVEEKKQPVISAAGKTDPGLVRDHNEDNYYIGKDIMLFIVADGVGGHQAGEKASEMVVEILPEKVKHILEEKKDFQLEELVGSISSAITELSHDVNIASTESSAYRGMGSTLISCFIYGNFGIFSYMGDSRAYLIRDSFIARLTEDHTVVGLMMKMGDLTQQEADMHPMRHIITRHVGMDGEFGPDTVIVDLKPGDKILMCSDGLNDMVTDQQISEIISSAVDIDEACENLVEAANNAGGRDNITVLIVKYGEDE
jgi:PPM family protein phosphatase